MKKLNLFRRISQIIVVVFVVFAGIRHQVVGGGPQGSAPLDSYCPFGGVEALFYYFKTGQFLDKTNASNFILLAAVIVLSIIAGSAFCGWLCPFGTVQEWLAKLGKKVFGRNFNLPAKVHNPLRYLRYVSLVAIIFFTARGSSLVFETYDPFKVLFHFNFETTTAIVIFVLTIVFSILVESFWCKYLCPLGAVISIFGKLNPVNIRRNKQECIECGLCSKNCPTCISVDKETKISNSVCTKCFECIGSCPKPNALTVHLGGGQ
jgi:polyferredoxin